MSGDQVNYNKISNSNSSGRRVDINDLLSRARNDEKKQRKENLFIEVEKKKYPASIILKPLNNKNIRSI